jgi:hypothetical protein
MAVGVHDQAIREAVATALEDAKTLVETGGAVDLQMLMHAATALRVAVQACDRVIGQDPVAYRDEASYARALAGQLAALANTSAQPGPGPITLSYDSTSFELHLSLGGRTLRLDLRKLTGDVARLAFARLRPVLAREAIAFAAAQPDLILVIVVGGIGYDLVSRG